MTLNRLLGATVMLGLCAFAQDPPSRVARLSFLNGPVSFQPATVDDWSAATLNYPLTTGDHLYADQGASAEVGIGPNFIRIAHQTNFGFLNLDDRTVQIRLTEGSLQIRIRALDDQEVWEVDTPNGAVSLLRTGEYRIDTDPTRNATMVTVRGGEAEVTANGQSFPVRVRQTGYFSGDGQEESIRDANLPDDFDRFAEDRDRQENSTPPPQFVSQNMVGYEDLNQYGTWEPESEYGPVWRPRVAAGWAPYHEGRWVWREPWGWTWVDEAPWGFAPFHYGRWAYVRGGWGWCPGPVLVARPVYAPALVAFVGAGVGVGWFPLGPRELYAPAYHVSPAYVRRVNFTNVREIDNITVNNIVVNRNVNNVYVNRGVPDAFTAVSRQDFVSARSVQRSERLDAGQFRSAPVAGFTPGYAPQRESVFGRAAGNVARPRDAVYNRQVFARTPVPAAQVPFSARQQALQENGGRPLGSEQLNSIRGNDASPRQPFVRSASPRNEGFGRPAAPQVAPQPTPQSAPQSGQQPRRSQDRFEAWPPQANPQVTPQPAQPRTDTVPENRNFGRNSQPRTDTRESAPAATPQVEPRAERPIGDGRNFGREREQRPPSTDKPREDRPKEDHSKTEKPKEEHKSKEEKKP